MTEPHACSDAEFISSFEGAPAIPPLLRLIARGRPVDLAELAAESAQPAPDLERILRAQPGTEWDDEGRLVGFGLSLRPTAHRYLVGGHTLYTWCATDTLFFTVILGTDAVAESTCPATGQPIRLEITPDAVTSVSPPWSRRLSTPPGRTGLEPPRPTCATTAISSPPRLPPAPGWRHTPTARSSASTDAFDHCRTACEELGWLVPGTTGR